MPALFEHSWARNAAIAVLVLLALFLAVETVNAITENRFIGAGLPATNTITLSGKGEVKMSPDIATIYFSVTKDAATVKEAQDGAAKASNAAIAFLKTQGIDEKDIQTSGYNLNPRYEYENAACTSNGYCPPGRQKLVGYTVTESVTVKIRNIDTAGDIVSGLGAQGVTGISGPSFTVEDEDAVIAQAREKAIADAKDKADQLARQLGVRLVRIVNFSESGNYPVPYYSFGKGGEAAMDARASAAPSFEAGQNTITSNVSVTYEIR